MNEDNTEPRPAPTGSSRKRTAALAAAVGVAGLLAGGLAAGALSAAAAEDSDSSVPAAHGPRPDSDPSRPIRSDEKLLTGETRSKVLAAVREKYPDATVQRVETDSDGVYEAHVLDDGEPVTVQVDKDFEVTGTQTEGRHHEAPR